MAKLYFVGMTNPELDSMAIIYTGRGFGTPFCVDNLSSAKRLRTALSRSHKGQQYFVYCIDTGDMKPVEVK